MVDLTVDNVETVSNAMDIQCSLAMNFHALVLHTMLYNTKFEFFEIFLPDFDLVV